MKQKLLSIIFVLTLVASLAVFAIAESDDLETENEVSEKVEDNQEGLLVLTLADTIELALDNNMEKRVTEKQMILQDIQLDIAGGANADLRRLERDMRSFADDLSSNVLAIQRSIDFVKEKTADVEILDEAYDELIEDRITRQFLEAINTELRRQIGLTTPAGALPEGWEEFIGDDEDQIPQRFVDEPARTRPPSDLIDAMEQAKAQAGEAYFEIRLGTNEIIKQANSMAASVLGLQATRNLDIEDAVNLIRTKTNQAAELLIRSDTDVTEGFKLLAESAFYGLIQADKMLQVQEKAYLRAQDQFTSANHTYNQGLLSSADLQLVNLQYNGAKMSLKSAEIDREKALIDFNMAIGLPIETKVDLTEPEYRIIDFTLEEAIDIAFDYRPDMFAARQELELAEKNLEFVDKKHKENTDAYKESQAYQDLKEIEYENVWFNAVSSIHKAYMDWQNAEYAYGLSLENLKIMQNQIEIAELAYELGFSSNASSPMSNLLQAQEQLVTIEQALAATEFGRNLALQNYLKEIGYAHYLRFEE
jgi:hypothetical protein